MRESKIHLPAEMNHSRRSWILGGGGISLEAQQAKALRQSHHHRRSDIKGIFRAQSTDIYIGPQKMVLSRLVQASVRWKKK